MVGGDERLCWAVVMFIFAAVVILSMLALEARSVLRENFESLLGVEKGMVNEKSPGGEWGGDMNIFLISIYVNTSEKCFLTINGFLSASFSYLQL